MRKPIVLLALLLPNLAWSQSWSGFQAAHPSFPCQDGWMGCMQDGERLQPELQRDTAGMPATPEMRIGWFDLEPTGNFTPFTALSAYTGEAPKRISEEPAGDATADAGANGAATPQPASQGADEGDAVADAAIAGGNAQDVRETEQLRLQEAETKRASQRAKEEAERARREEEMRRREADERAAAAKKAMQLAQQAATDAERQRLQGEAAAAEAARAQAERAAADAERLRQERDRQEAEKRAAAEKAAAEARKAEQERERREAEQARKAEEQRKAEEARRVQAEKAAQVAAEQARREAEAEAKRKADEAERRAAEAAAKAQAARNDAERKRLEEERRRAEEEQRQAEAEAKRKADEAARVAAEEARRKAEEEERRIAAERAAKEKEAERQRQEAERATAMAAQQQQQAEGGGDAAAAGDCSDLLQLETKAVLGKLDAPTVQCLEQRLTSSTRQTEKGKVSRLLMSNAFAGGKTKDWEGLMKRHLEEIDQSDPDLCYKYALQLARSGSAYGAIKWADVALENRSVWTGNTYTARVYSLYKVRTVAAQQIWQDLENKHTQNPTDESNEAVKNARNRTKVYAREWYEYAKVAGKDTTDALDTCKSAAGTTKYCEAG